MTALMPDNATSAATSLPPILERRVRELAGARPVHARPVVAGMTLAQRWIITFDNGTSAFLKAAANPTTAAWLRKEHLIYSLDRTNFLPRLIGWVDEGRPILLLEDLSAAVWPDGADWLPARIERVLQNLKRLHQTPAPPGLEPASAQGRYLRCWGRIATDPRPFLKLDVCSPAWLVRSLPALQSAEKAARLNGERFVHGDVQSGNVCFQASRCLFIDWNWAALGNPALDLIRFALSVCQSGNTPPESIAPGEAQLLALIAGHAAYHATLPPSPQAPALPHAQKKALALLLPWTARVLGLDAVDR